MLFRDSVKQHLNMHDDNTYYVVLFDVSDKSDLYQIPFAAWWCPPISSTQLYIGQLHICYST